MLIALLIIARTAQIGASILLAGTFTFELVTLAPARRPAGPPAAICMRSSGAYSN